MKDTNQDHDHANLFGKCMVCSSSKSYTIRLAHTGILHEGYPHAAEQVEALTV
jgi:hypothetical protein